jgi:hypothetical protein
MEKEMTLSRNSSIAWHARSPPLSITTCTTGMLLTYHSLPSDLDTVVYPVECSADQLLA